MKRLSLLIVASCMLALSAVASAQAAPKQATPKQAAPIEVAPDQDMGLGLMAKDPDADTSGITPRYRPAYNCVDGDYHRHPFSRHVHVVNHCMTTKRVKVIIAFGFDSRCHFLAPGRSFTYAFRIGRWDGIAQC
jgi:hypothetical protein